MKPEKCPACGSDEIGELDSILELPYTDEEYEVAGGRYYCVACGWGEDKLEPEAPTIMKVKIIVYGGGEFRDDTTEARMVEVRLRELKREFEFNGVKTLILKTDEKGWLDEAIVEGQHPPWVDKWERIE